MCQGHELGRGACYTFCAMLTTPRALGSTVCSGRQFDWGSRTYIMGVVNVTTDSFSGDGVGTNVRAAVSQAARFQQEGVDILDVGGESTRPGHTPISVDEELRRVIPAIEAIATAVDLPISVDTYKPGVARRALRAGASMVNDVWGTSADTNLVAVAVEGGVPIVLMHNQQGIRYHDLVPEVVAALEEAARRAVQAGVPWESIILDPGLGFGKTGEHNLALLRRLPELRELGRPVLVGSSRKSTIGQVLDLPVEERLEGTAATVALSIAGGADIVRVHDVKAMARVARMSDAVVRGWQPPV